jgi:hypothetical protein
MKFLAMKKLRLRNVAELLGLPDDEARVILSQLINNNAIEPYFNDYYRKSAQFQQILKRKIEEFGIKPPTKADMDGL